MRRAWLATSLLSALAVSARASTRVFVLPHSHQDTGWLRTVDEYYTEYVRGILSNVVASLSADARRTFLAVEVAFWMRWWADASPAQRESVKRLVGTGQLEFVNGGWVMADEGSTMYEGVVNQITLGHRWLADTLGFTPQYAWHIDPFGSSATFVDIFHDLGYEAFVINRIDYQLKSAWQSSASLEFVWQGSASRGNGSSIFTHVLDSHYSSPYTFQWEYTCPGCSSDASALADSNPPILVTNAEQPFTQPNIEERAQALVAECQRRSAFFLTPHLLLPLGDDFKYANADVQFANIELLMAYINANNASFGVTLEYGTLGTYFQATKAWAASNGVAFPTYAGDFFPYAFAPSGDNFEQPGWASADSYWSGYYTSRPQVKGASRLLDGLLVSTEQLVATAGVAITAASNQSAAAELLPWASSQVARRVSAILKHHDAETGTARPLVVNDYLGRVSGGATAAGELATNAATILLAAHGSGSAAPTATDFTLDPATLAAACTGNTIPVTVFNPLAQQRREFIRLNMACGTGVTVTRWDESSAALVAVPAQINPGNVTLTLSPIPFDPASNPTPPQPPPPPSPAAFDLWILADMPPVGFITLFVTAGAPATALGLAAKGSVSTPTLGTTISLSNTVTTLTFDTYNGTLRNISSCGVSIAATQTFAAYGSQTAWPSSDPYVFRPVMDAPIDIMTGAGSSVPSLVRVEGPLVHQLALTYIPTGTSAPVAYVQQIVTLFTDPLLPVTSACPNISTTSMSPAWQVRMYLTVGLPTVNQELVMRYWTDVNNTRLVPSEQVVRTRDAAPCALNTGSSERASHLRGGAKLAACQRLHASPSSRVADTVSLPVMYTDANGLEMRQRVKDHFYWAADLPPYTYLSEPTAHNYYPSPSAVFIADEDGAQDRQLSFVHDRSRGVATLAPGELELMLHRRNHIGNDIPLDDTSILSIQLDASVGRQSDGTASFLWRTQSQRLLTPAVVMYANNPATPAAWLKSHTSSRSALRSSVGLPPAMRLQTLEVVNASSSRLQVLVRLRHTFAVGEHPTLSQPCATVLAALLAPTMGTMAACNETSLSGGLPRTTWNITAPVVLTPMLTRTFVCTIQTPGA